MTLPRGSQVHSDKKGILGFIPANNKKHLICWNCWQTPREGGRKKLVWPTLDLLQSPPPAGVLQILKQRPVWAPCVDETTNNRSQGAGWQKRHVGPDGPAGQAHCSVGGLTTEDDLGVARRRRLTKCVAECHRLSGQLHPGKNIVTNGPAGEAFSSSLIYTIHTILNIVLRFEKCYTFEHTKL